MRRVNWNAPAVASNAAPSSGCAVSLAESPAASCSVSRIELLRDVWDTSYDGGSNVVDTIIRGLRRKLDRHAERIETVTRIGYRWR